MKGKLLQNLGIKFALLVLQAYQLSSIPGRDAICHPRDVLIIGWEDSVLVV